MSYILDALNKSEQERRGQQTPGLQTVHRAPPPKASSKAPWIVVIAIFAVINLAGLGYWLMSNEPTPAPVVTQQSAANPPATTPASQPQTSSQNQPAVTLTHQVTEQPVVQQTPVASTAPTTNTADNNQTPGLLITPDTAFQKPTNQPVRITELPLNVQRQIPDLVFSSHLFSDEPSFRMVNINGKMIREGDMVANDLRLLEISEEGVILGFRHYVFEVSVLRDWSFN
jgi:general secretion pathway protein B